jgi:hypothetical protein
MGGNKYDEPLGFIHPVTGKRVKLGRTVVRHTGRSRKRMARMEAFLNTLAPPPASVDYTSGIAAWGMMLNDDLGDCTIAGPGHLVQAWTALSGSEVTIPDSDILAAYEAFDGYVNGDASTDNGGDLLTVCQDWAASGIGGHVITAHAAVAMNQVRLSQGIYVFGGLNAGVMLPVSAQSQVGSVWDVVGDGQSGDSAPGSWGGHCTAIVGYDASGITLVTWGALQKATWNFVNTYYDEAHAIISPDYKVSPDAQNMASDLRRLETND